MGPGQEPYGAQALWAQARALTGLHGSGPGPLRTLQAQARALLDSNYFVALFSGWRSSLRPLENNEQILLFSSIANPLHVIPSKTVTENLAEADFHGFGMTRKVALT